MINDGFKPLSFQSITLFLLSDQYDKQQAVSSNPVFESLVLSLSVSFTIIRCELNSRTKLVDLISSPLQWLSDETGMVRAVRVAYHENDKQAYTPQFPFPADKLLKNRHQ